jgi:hypothetical protein
MNKLYLRLLILVALGFSFQLSSLNAQDANKSSDANKAKEQGSTDKKEEKKADEKSDVQAKEQPADKKDEKATAPSVAQKAPEPEVQLSPWRGTSFMYRNDVNIMSLDKSKDITYNPNYSMQYMIAPRYWLGERLFLTTSLYIVQELTQPDDAKYKNELRWFDSSFVVGGILKRLALGPVNTTIIGSTGVRLPLSIYSRAQSMRFGIPVGLSINNSFKMIQFGYSLGFLYNFFKYSTGNLDAPTIQNCINVAYNCDQFSNTGIRNPKMQFAHGLSLNILPNDKLAFSITATIIHRILHDAATTDQVNYTPQKPTDERFVISAMMEVSYQLTDELQIAFNTWAFNPQLAPDSTYYVPFFNRFTSLGLELRFSPTSLRALQKRLGG